MSYPASKHGLMDQCAAIESKTQWIRTKYSMGPLGGLASDFTLSSSLEHLHGELKFGSHGKVGMFIRKDTADLLDRILCDGELDHGEDVETQDGSRNEISSGVSPFDTELTSEMVQDTLEGLDKDLLGVNSQEALNKLTAFVSKTVEENHPAGRNRVVGKLETDKLRLIQVVLNIDILRKYGFDCEVLACDRHQKCEQKFLVPPPPQGCQ